MSFELDISRFVKKANGNTETIVRRISLELFSKVVMKSPVDTGRFRGNWFLTVNTPSNQTLERFDAQPYGSQPSSNVFVDAQSKAKQWKMKDNAIYITNNLPYAERLEVGYSKQAPAGMARISVMEIAGQYA